MIYEELSGDIEPLLRFHKLSKAKDMSIKQVVNLLQSQTMIYQQLKSDLKG